MIKKELLMRDFLMWRKLIMMINKKPLKSLEFKQTCSTTKLRCAQNSRSSVFFLKLIRNYLLMILKELNYEDYENELNDELEEPWFEDGVPYEVCDHICKPFRFKNGKAKWPTCYSNEDGFCNGGELPGMVRIGYMTYFQDYEWYNELAGGNLKKEAFKQKAIYERSCGDASQSVMNFCAWLKRSFRNFHELDYELLVKLQDYWWKVNDHECSPFSNWRDHIRGPYVNFFTTYDPHLDINSIFGMNKNASNMSNVQDEERNERCNLFNDTAHRFVRLEDLR
ncbi:hypothetical protein Tco_0006548 [Tanacetum coccineum]